MAEQQAQPKAGGSMGKNIVRGIVGLLAVVAIAAAGMDFMGKSSFEKSNKAIADKLDGDGVAVADLAGLINGSPTVIGDPAKDAEVTYRWGVIRSYDLKLVFAGDGEQRSVVQILE